ncbi:unnamed protein product [Amoebophrya sp. A25]|nr:unnamed protein product [Amoebophrya sp. A25]|eukprot:GSA25T00011646001.1
MPNPSLLRRSRNFASLFGSMVVVGSEVFHKKASWVLYHSPIDSRSFGLFDDQTHSEIFFALSSFGSNPL